MAKKKKISEYDRFMALSDAEKDAEVAQYEGWEIPLSETRPLTKAQRKQWNRIQRKLNRGRPKVGRGSKHVAVSLELDLLKRADRFAKKHDMKRSELVAYALELAMRPPSLYPQVKPREAAAQKASKTGKERAAA